MENILDLGVHRLMMMKQTIHSIITKLGQILHLHQKIDVSVKTSLGKGVNRGADACI